jgi:hypothetical protein
MLWGREPGDAETLKYTHTHTHTHTHTQSKTNKALLLQAGRVHVSLSPAATILFELVEWDGPPPSALRHVSLGILLVLNPEP